MRPTDASLCMPLSLIERCKHCYRAVYKIELGIKVYVLLDEVV